MVKAECQASMSTREIHDLEVLLDLASGNVLVEQCTCKAGNSGYCNHVISLLLELPRYSLEDLKGFLRKQHVQACLGVIIN